MPGNRGNAAERLGHDVYAEMALAARRPRMAGVHVTLVLNGQECRREPALEALAQALFAVRLRRFALTAQPHYLGEHEDEHCDGNTDHLEADPHAVCKIARHIDI